VCQQRVAIGVGLRDLCGAERAAGATLVLDHDRLAELLRELVEHQPRHYIAAGPRRERHHRMDRFRRPVRHGILLSRSGAARSG